MIGRTYLAGVAVILAACGGGADSTSTTVNDAPTSTAPPSEHERECPGSAVEVRYQAWGSASGVSYTAALPSGTSQGEASLPLKNQNGALGLRFCQSPGEFLYFSVQNMGDSGSVGCTIEVDGEVAAKIESSGAYVIATCDR